MKQRKLLNQPQIILCLLVVFTKQLKPYSVSYFGFKEYPNKLINCKPLFRKKWRVISSFLAIFSLCSPLFICLIFAFTTVFFSCQQESDITWTKTSNFLGDTCIRVELPNVVSFNSDFDEACNGDPYSLNLSYLSVIGRDTLKTVITSKIRNKYMVNSIYRTMNDSAMLDQFYLDIKVLDTATRLISSNTLKKGKEVFYVINYSLNGKNGMMVHYIYRRNHFKMNIDNIKDEYIENKILNSLSFEDNVTHFCW